MATKMKSRSLRARVAAAFQKMAQGVRRKAAFASTVAFYRAGGQEWTKQLG